MKKRIAICLMSFFSFFSITEAQIVFGVNAGTGITDGIVGTTLSGYAGYSVSQKFTPYLEFQYVHGALEEAIITTGKVSDLTSITGDIMIPKLGVKYWLKSKNAITSYLNVTVMKPIVSITEEMEDGEINENLQMFSDNLDLWGFSAGFGVEYFLDENFSIGGEYGVRSIMATSQVPKTGESESGNSGDEYTMSFVPTYGKLSVNFYF